MACPIWEREDETVIHALWTCPSAQDAWGYGPAKLQKYSSAQTSFLCLIEDLLERCDREDIEFLAVLERKLWLHRNSLAHEGTFAHPSQVLREAKESLEDFHCHKDKEGERVGLRENQPIAVWQAPVSGIIKVNWDVAVDVKKGLVGVSINIVRDFW